MNETAFVNQKEPQWKRLSQLCDRADVSPSHLDSEQLKDFIRLYRCAASDLAVVRTHSDNEELALFLNDLVARAYGILYRAPKKGFRQAVSESVALAAQTVRKLVWFVVASLAIFGGSIVLGYVAIGVQPELRDAIVPPDFEESFEGWKSGIHDERSLGESMAATGVYSSNNPQAAITGTALALSTFGLGTIYVLNQNGLIFAALLREVVPVGKAGHLVVSVAPHGVTEISGLILSGAAGLALGWALFAPGRRSRGDALAEAARDAIVVLATAVVMMFIAAPIEGFFSFNPLVPDWVKAGFAVLSALAWAAFWLGYGRTETAQ